MPDQTAEFIRVKRRSTEGTINITNEEVGLVDDEEE